MKVVLSLYTRLKEREKLWESMKSFKHYPFWKSRIDLHSEEILTSETHQILTLCLGCFIFSVLLLA